MSETIEEVDYKKLLEDEKKKVSVLEQKLRLYEQNSPARAYYVAQKILNQRVDFLSKFNLEEELKKNPKDDKVYDRATELSDGLPAFAIKVNCLKDDLNLTGDESKDVSKKSSFLDRNV